MADLDEGMWLNGTEPHLWRRVARSHPEYEALSEGLAGLTASRRMLEKELARALPAQATSFLPGYCSACRCYRPLAYDHMYAPNHEVNWRERLVCSVCQLNNRLRLSLHLFETLAPAAQAIYLTEALTPFARAIKERRPGVVMSEFLGPSFQSGQNYRNGVRHEDITGLSFKDESFDCLMTFDVLEHVPAYQVALSEFYRVLRPGGMLMLSAPFVVSSSATVCRARVDADGKIHHLLPPEYHGDPVGGGQGILCYYHFGWDLVEQLRARGFNNVIVEMYWSLDYGYIGPEQLMILARK